MRNFRLPARRNNQKLALKLVKEFKTFLDAIVTRLPAPKGNPETAPRALIFDSYFDMYRGVVVLVRVLRVNYKKEIR